SPLDSEGGILLSLFPPSFSPDIFVFTDLMFDSIPRLSPLRVVPVPLRTSLWEYATMWGLFAIPIAALVVVSFMHESRCWPSVKRCGLVIGLLALFCLAWSATVVLAGPIAFMLAILCLGLAFRGDRRADACLWFLLGMAFLWYLI